MLGVEQREPEPVDGPGGGQTHTVVQQQPAFGGEERRCAQAHLVRIPPGSLARAEEDRVIAPVAEVGAPREPDVRRVPRRRRDRTVDQRPAPVELAREECRVFVLGGHHHAAALVRPKVAGGREADERTAVGVAGVDDQVLVTAAGDARVLDAEALGLRGERRLQAVFGFDHPVREAVGAPRRTEVGDAGAVLDAN